MAEAEVGLTGDGSQGARGPRSWKGKKQRLPRAPMGAQPLAWVCALTPRTGK